MYGTQPYTAESIKAQRDFWRFELLCRSRQFIQDETCESSTVGMWVTLQACPGCGVRSYLNVLSDILVHSVADNEQDNGGHDDRHWHRAMGDLDWPRARGLGARLLSHIVRNTRRDLKWRNVCQIVKKADLVYRIVRRAPIWLGLPWADEWFHAEKLHLVMLNGADMPLTPEARVLGDIDV